MNTPAASAPPIRFATIVMEIILAQAPKVSNPIATAGLNAPKHSHAVAKAPTRTVEPIAKP